MKNSKQSLYAPYCEALEALNSSSSISQIKDIEQDGKYIILNSKNGSAKRLLNFSSNDYLGISNDKNKSTVDYVIGTMPKDQLEKLEKITDLSEQIINDYLNINFDNLMNKYNKL